jgi:hypothetical protein
MDTSADSAALSDDSNVLSCHVYPVPSHDSHLLVCDG